MKYPKRRAKSARQLDREIAEALGAHGPRRARKRKPATPKHAPKNPHRLNPHGLPMVQIKMTQNGPQAVVPDARPISPLKTLHRLDHEATKALITKQRALHQQLEAIAEDLLTLSGKMHDHAAGFRHVPETCTTCAAIEKEQR